MRTLDATARLGRGLAKLSTDLVLLLFSATCLFPVIWIAYSSLKPLAEFERDPMALPTAIEFGNYAKVFGKLDMGTLLFNSFFNTIASLAAIVVLSFLLAYPLSRFRFKGRAAIYAFLMFGMLIPVHGIMVPLFVQFQELGLYDTRWALILPYVAFGLPMSVFLIESYVRTIPREMEEAAAMEGYGLYRTMAGIIWPLCRPAISTVVVLQFFSRWNEFAFALILIRSKSLKTLPLGLTVFTSDYSTEYTQLMAALAISILPVLAVYLALSKRVMEGMTVGAVKG